MNKTALKFISKLSKQLPTIMFTAAIEMRRVSGSDLIQSNTYEVDGIPVDSEKTYRMRMPVQRDIDHKRRMKEIYKKRGKVGLITYLRPYIKPEKFGEVQVYIMNNLL